MQPHIVPRLSLWPPSPLFIYHDLSLRLWSCHYRSVSSKRFGSRSSKRENVLSPFVFFGERILVNCHLLGESTIGAQLDCEYFLISASLKYMPRVSQPNTELQKRTPVNCIVVSNGPFSCWLGFVRWKLSTPPRWQTMDFRLQPRVGRTPL